MRRRPAGGRTDTGRGPLRHRVLKALASTIAVGLLIGIGAALMVSVILLCVAHSVDTGPVWPGERAAVCEVPGCGAPTPASEPGGDAA